MPLGLPCEYQLVAAGPPVGVVGLVTGVVLAIVPPRPVRIPDCSFGGAKGGALFAVMEQGVGGMVALGVIRAGLCGLPIAITKGITALVAELVLSFRFGEAGRAMGSTDDDEAEGRRGVGWKDRFVRGIAELRFILAGRGRGV